MTRRPPTRKQLDDAFPTIVRYLGIALVIFYALGQAFGLMVPESLLIAATGLILYKTVRGNGNGGPSASP